MKTPLNQKSPTSANGQGLIEQNKNTNKIPTIKDIFDGLKQKEFELIENENMIVSTFNIDTL